MTWVDSLMGWWNSNSEENFLGNLSESLGEDSRILLIKF